MKRLILTESQIVSLLNNNGKPFNDIFYREGDFTISNDRMNKSRNIFYPYYKNLFNEDKNEIIHKIAFSKTMKMLDNGEKLPEFGDYKMYHSFTDIPFSKKQVEYVEKKIFPQFVNMTLEELYDYMLIESEKNSYELKNKCKKAVSDLLNQGFFDTFLNGSVKELALWTLGKANNITNMLSWLYAKNRFTHKTNIKTIEAAINKIKDEILNNDDKFMINPIFLALEEIGSSIYKLEHPK